jgi:hypothetical protein
MTPNAREQRINKGKRRIADAIEARMREQGVTQTRIRNTWAAESGKTRGTKTIKNVIEARNYEIDSLLYMLDVLGMDLKEL